MTARVAEGLYFGAPTLLPRGRHRLTRDQVLAAQRERLMAAMAELMAERGYHGFSIGDVATRSGVSRSAFYECFADKEACAFAAYERFIEVLLAALAERLDPAEDWNGFIVGLLEGYLGTLQRDLVVARAFQVEMDAVGAEARARRRQALVRFADFIRTQHERLRDIDPRLEPVSAQAYLGVVYAIRQVACDALDEHPEPDLLAIVPQLAGWVAESFRASPRPSAGVELRSGRPSTAAAGRGTSGQP